jgi:peptidoglycan pentaglycine glycine transferase (the first glycine)
MREIQLRKGDNKTESEWDGFLESSPYGHFEQSAAWAKAKKFEGWRCERVEITKYEQIIGGFQLLYRHQGLVKIGYITKGPVCESEDVRFVALVINQIKSLAQKHKLSALLVQPAERDHTLPQKMLQRGFLPNRLHQLIEANLLIDVSQDYALIRNGMSRQTRQKIRQSIQRGVKIRVGGESNLPLFFQLMLATCRRQGNAKPNPRSLDSIRAIWKCLSKDNHVRLTFAEVENEPVSALLGILFGDRMTFWKKGWNSKHADRHPNELLFNEALEWAHKHRFTICDFAALDRGIAKTLIDGKKLSSQQLKSRHFSHIGFGGYPVLLPSSYVWFPNPIIRKYYSIFCSFRSKA